MNRQITYHLAWFLLLALMLATAGCGIYSFSGNMAGHLKTIAIPTFENQTPEFGLAEDLTDAIVDRFTRDGTLKIRSSRDADSILMGTIVSVRDMPFGYNADTSVDEYKITVVVQMSFEDRVQGEMVWQETVSQFGLYPYSSGSREERQEGIDEAIEKIAEDALNRTVAGW